MQKEILNVKHLQAIESVIPKDWDNPHHIMKLAEKQIKKKLNWYTINYYLETLHKQKKIQKMIIANNKTLWKKN